MIKKILINLTTKAIFSGGKYVYQNSGERKRRKDAIEHYGNRTIIEIGILYSIGFLICRYLMSKGIMGIIFILLGFLGKYMNLKEASIYVNVNREKTAMIIVGILLLLSLF